VVSRRPLPARRSPDPVSRLPSARQEWEDGRRRLAAEARDERRYLQLCALVDVVLDELRRRVGHTFSLEQLAEEHAVADDWVRELVREATPSKAAVGVRDVALVQDAAFAAYARGAGDYGP